MCLPSYEGTNKESYLKFSILYLSKFLSLLFLKLALHETLHVAYFKFTRIVFHTLCCAIYSYPTKASWKESNTNN